MWLYFLYMFKPSFSEEASMSFPSSWRQHNTAKVKIFPPRTGFLASFLAQDLKNTSRPSIVPSSVTKNELKGDPNTGAIQGCQSQSDWCHLASEATRGKEQRKGVERKEEKGEERNGKNIRLFFHITKLNFTFNKRIISRNGTLIILHLQDTQRHGPSNYLRWAKAACSLLLNMLEKASPISEVAFPQAIQPHSLCCLLPPVSL